MEFFCHPCLDEPLARGSLGVGVKNIHTTEQHLLKGNAGRHACIFDDKESTSERYESLVGLKMTTDVWSMSTSTLAVGLVNRYQYSCCRFGQ